MIFLRRVGALGLISLLFLTGCAAHVAYVQTTDLGIDVALDPSSQGQVKFTLGYDKETFALVPKYVTSSTTAKQEDKAMSVVAVSHVQSIGLLNTVIFNNVVATGAAAKAMANDAEGLQLMRNAVYHPPSAATTPTTPTTPVAPVPAVATAPVVPTTPVVPVAATQPSTTIAGVH